MKSASDHLLAGRVMLIAAAILWSTNGIFVKLIHEGGEGPSGIVIAFYRSFTAALVFTPVAARRVSQLNYTPWFIASVLSFTLMTVSFIVATTMTTAANAIILQYTSVIWVFALSPLLLAESVDRREWPLLVLAMVGVGVIFFGSFSGGDMAGVLIGLVSGFGFGCITLALRKLRDVNALLVIWVNNIGSTVLILPLALVSANLHVSQRALMLLAIMGVFQFAIPYMLFSGGLKFVPAAQASLILLLEPVLNPIWVWSVVGEVPAVTTFIGGGILLTTVAFRSFRR